MNIEELIKERKSLCNLLFFTKAMGYTYSWVHRAEHGKVNVSVAFWKKYAETVKKIKKIVKK